MLCAGGQQLHPRTRLHRAECSLCSFEHEGRKVLKRCRKRNVEWPSKQPQQDQCKSLNDEDYLGFSSFEDAFNEMAVMLKGACKECRRYHRGREGDSEQDQYHCDRFHNERNSFKPTKRTTAGLASKGDGGVDLVVAPGTYAVTAGDWGGERRQTHVVRVKQGQSVSLDFAV